MEGERLQVFIRKDGRYAWRKKDGNNQIVATDGGQGFEQRAGAQAAASREFPTLPVEHLDAVEDDATTE